MRLIGIIILSGFISINAYTQQSATTDDGKRVTLNADGTWKYKELQKETINENDSLLKTMSRPVTSKGFVKSKRTNLGLWYNTGKWKEVNLNDASPVMENFFQMKKGDAYCITISERIKVPLENLKEVVLKGIEMKADSYKLDKHEYRIINGAKVLYMQTEATVKGIDFIYTGYYTSDESGTMQVLCYTAKELFNSYENEFQEMLNGIVLEKTIKQ